MTQVLLLNPGPIERARQHLADDNEPFLEAWFDVFFLLAIQVRGKPWRGATFMLFNEDSEYAAWLAQLPVVKRLAVALEALRRLRDDPIGTEAHRAQAAATISQIEERIGGLMPLVEAELARRDVGLDPELRSPIGFIQ